MYRSVVIAVLAGMLVPAAGAQRAIARSAGPRAAPAARMVAPRAAAPMRVAPAFRHGVVLNGSFGFRRGSFFPRHHHRHRLFFTGCFGWPYCGGAHWAYPYAAGPIFWPSYDYAPAEYAAPVYDDTALRLELQRLTDEIEELRQQQEVRPPKPAPAVLQPERLSPLAVFVLRNGARIETRNYGIVRQTVWVLTERHARMIRVGDLDITATNKANEARGIDLVIPSQR